MTRVAESEMTAGATQPQMSALLAELESMLGAAVIESPRITAREILAALMDVPRSWPALNPDASIAPSVALGARNAVRRLAAGAPFAYAVGRSQFRHLNLRIDERVLIPRPETEILVDQILARFLAMETAGEDWGIAVDVGTGSGAIALSLASEGRFARVVATDSSLDALQVAQQNAEFAAQSLNCGVEFRCGSLLGPVEDLRTRLLVSNPPYIAFDEAGKLPLSVRNWEPPTALLSGSSGLDATAAIVQKGVTLLEPGGILALEVDERRALLVAEMVMSQVGYIDVEVLLDLTGRERFVFASRA